MCRVLWTARVLDWQKPFPHSWHLKGFSLEWMYLEGNPRGERRCLERGAHSSSGPAPPNPASPKRPHPSPTALLPPTPPQTPLGVKLFYPFKTFTVIPIEA